MATTTPSSTASLAFTRPSHSGGLDHVVVVDAVSLRPSSCTCAAGQRQRLCWAVIDVASTELVPLAQQRWAAAKGLDQITDAARLLTQVRRWAATARELQSLRSCGLGLTDGGRADLHPDGAA